MQGFFSAMATKFLETAATLVEDENDCDIAPASVSQADVEFAEGLSLETFSAFPKDKLDSTWIMVPAQEAHARAILEESTNIRDIRFKLCPAHLSDEDFWQIYFVVTQKDGVEESDQNSLSSSWGILSAESDTEFVVKDTDIHEQ